MKAALTGHMVLSTLHTNDAPSTINRLMNMGIEPFLVASSVHLICAQRLVRRGLLQLQAAASAAAGRAGAGRVLAGGRGHGGVVQGRRLRALQPAPATRAESASTR